jgi:AraC-like DNA-binding protein/ligand-binding sensor protein
MDIGSIEMLEKVAFHYTQCTGVNCVFVQDLETHFCPFSKYWGECLDCHKKAIAHSEEFGGSYVYLCPKDLLLWTSPVMKNGQVVGAFIAGPVLSIEPDEIDIPGLDVKNIKTVSPEIAYSLSRVLFMCSSFVFSELNLQIKMNELSLSVQSSINESIQELKDNRLRKGVKAVLQSLGTAIKMGNEKLSKKRFSECASIFFSDYDQSMETVRSWSTLVVNAMLSGALEGQADEVSACNEAVSTIKKINTAEKPEEVANLLDACRKSFCRMMVESIMDNGFNPAILKAIHYIQYNLANPFSESDVAKYVQLSISHFSRLFNAEVGMSFSKYINKLRTERAKELLIASNMSILDICEATGYEEQSYFTRIFKRYQGMSPNAFRMKTGKYPNDDMEIHN